MLNIPGRNSHGAASLLGCALTVLTCMSTTHAQAPEGTEANAAAETGKGSALEEIVVTANKRPESLREVAYSVEALDASVLEEMGAQEFADYLNAVSGVSFVDSGSSGVKVTMRGLSTSLMSETQSTVGIYLDEAPVTDPGGAPAALLSSFDLKLVDVKQVEVLKGPQGTLFGAGSLGGTIRILTEQPDLSRTAAFIQADVSSTRRGGLNHDEAAMMNLPLIEDELALRGVVYSYDREGYIDNELRGEDDVNDEQTRGGRLSMLWRPDERLSLTLRALRQEKEVGGVGAVTIGAGDLVQLNRSPESAHDDSSLYNVVATYSFDNFDLVSSSSLFERDLHVAFDISRQGEALFPGQALQQNSRTDARDLTQEVRLVSTSQGDWQWIAGLYYFDQQRDFQQFIPDLPSVPMHLYTSQQVADFEELAVFGEVTYAITERLKATAGVRGFQADLHFSSNADGLFAGGSVSDRGSGSDDGVLPRFTFLYELSDAHVLYATASQGYRRGGVNGSAPLTQCGSDLARRGFANGNPPTFSSDSVWNYELGARTLWLDRRLAIDGSVYMVDWTDLPIAVQLECGYTFNVNSGKARTEGFETQIRMQLTDGVEINGTYTYTDSQLRSESPAIGARPGDRAPGVPLHQGSLGLMYSLPLTASLEAYVRGDVQYVDTRLTEYNRAIAREMPSYMLGGVKLGLRGDLWRGYLYVDNVSDERAHLNRHDPLEYIVVNRPRTIGLSIARDF